MDYLAILTKAKNDLKEKNQRRTEIVELSRVKRDAIVQQKKTSETLRADHQQMRIQLSKGIDEKAVIAANAAGVHADFRKTFVLHVVDGLKKEVDHNLISSRFKLVDSDNKIMMWEQELSDLQEELKLLDRELVKMNRKLNFTKQCVRESLTKLEEQLCLSN